MEEEYARAGEIGPHPTRVVGRDELWSQLLSYARVNFNMGFDEFMSITPRYFDELMKQHRFNVERAERGRDFMLSQLIAMVANTGTRSFEEPRQPVEFLPKWQREGTAAAQPTKRRKRSDIANQVRGVLTAFMR